MPDYLDDILSRLTNAVPCGYSSDAAPATEPTSLAAMALAAHERWDAAQRALDWLVESQAADGSLGVRRADPTPCWPTALAVLAWSRNRTRYDRPLHQATRWILEARGKPQPRSVEMGHDSTLVGWPWVIGTHSWIEPTAWNVLALKSVGRSEHSRAREAARLLVDRLLPAGGCNYGNTLVLGQELRPHIQPTGLTLLALSGHDRLDPRIAASLDYLERELSATTPLASLCYGLLGLAAHGRFPEGADDWLATAAARSQAHRGGDWKFALVALAALGSHNPLFSSAA